MSIGKFGCLPNIRKNGESWVVVCIVEFAAMHIQGSCSDHESLAFPSSIDLRNLPRSRWNLSVMLDQ